MYDVSKAKFLCVLCMSEIHNYAALYIICVEFETF